MEQVIHLQLDKDKEEEIQFFQMLHQPVVAEVEVERLLQVLQANPVDPAEAAEEKD